MSTHLGTTQIHNRLEGQTIRRISTRGRGSGRTAFVELELYGADTELELHPAPGWKLVSSMINTLRYKPEIVMVVGESTATTRTLKVQALGGYKVAEFIVLWDGPKTRESFLDAFVLLESERQPDVAHA